MSDKTHIVSTAVGSPAARMHPLVQALVERGADAAQLRELLAVQREWDAGEAMRAFTGAMVALKAHLPTVLARDATVDYAGAKGRVHYTHTSLAAAVAAVTEPLTAHGFSVSWIPRTTERLVEVTCRLTHLDGHVAETTIAAPPDTSGSKSPAQAIASTITLLERYTLLALLGIATADMSDPAPAAASSAAGEGIDTARNLRAVAAIAHAGRTREDAEALVGRRVAEWTGADLERLREWLRERAKPAPR